MIGVGAYYAAASGIHGKVGAIFDATAHLFAADLVITLGSLSTINHPFTLTVPCLPKGLRPGQRFSLTSTLLSIEPCFSFGLKGMAVFKPPQRVSFCGEPAKIIEGLVHSKEVVATTPPKGGLHCLLNKRSEPDVLIRPILPIVYKTIEVMRKHDWLHFCKLSTKLSGVGPGLTPSGDDFLAGVVAALRFIKKSMGAGPTEKQLQDLTYEAAENTSNFSGFLLKAAGKGLICEPACDWLQSLLTADFPARMQAEKKLLPLGHSSGVDMLSGMIIASQSVIESEAMSGNG